MMKHGMKIVVIVNLLSISVCSSRQDASILNHRILESGVQKTSKPSDTDIVQKSSEDKSWVKFLQPPYVPINALPREDSRSLYNSILRDIPVHNITDDSPWEPMQNPHIHVVTKTEETRRKKETNNSDKIQISELKSDTKVLNPVFHGNEKLKTIPTQNSTSEHHQKQVVNQNLAIRQHQTHDIHQNPTHGQHQTHHINQNLGYKHHQTQELNQNHIHVHHQPQVLNQNHGVRAHQTPGKHQKLVHVQHQTQDLYQKHRNGQNQPLLVSKLDYLSSPDPNQRVPQRGEPSRLYSRIQNYKRGFYKPSPALKKNPRQVPVTVGRRNIQSWRNSSRRSGRELIPRPELALGLSTLILGSILAV